MSNETIYLDHSATTPADPRVVEAMLPYFTTLAGNPSSVHHVGRAVRSAVDEARDTVAEILSANRQEIIFTSGGSESDNLALIGVAYAQRQKGAGNHIITSAIEHHAIGHTAEYLKSQGFEITYLPVDKGGLVSLDDLRAAIRPTTVLVSIMYANNEIGAIQPIAAIGALCREKGIPFHSDAVQAAGLLPLNVADLNVDLMTLTAHKFYGPKGTGILYVRRGITMLPQLHGGSQEKGRRAGTENVAGIVGFAAALKLAEERRTQYAAHCTALRDRLIAGVTSRIPDVQINGDREQRLANNANLRFAGVENESMLLLLDQRGICVSAGSACTSGAVQPSHVLTAIGLSPDEANSSLRFTVGKDTTPAQIDATVEALAAVVAQLRGVAVTA